MLKSAGIIPIAYISIGEAEDYRYYWNETWYENPPDWLGRENPDWPECYAVKYWYDEWKQIIFGYVKKIINQGFMGVYLDKVDEFEYWSDPDNGENFTIPEDVAAYEMIEFIIEIAEYARSLAGNDFWIIPQNGERILDYDNGTLLRTISAWGVEDLFYNGSERLPEAITEERVRYLRLVREQNKPVLVVDYVDDGTGYQGENLERIRDFVALAKEYGFVPYVARIDRELDELVIIPDIQPPR